MPVWTQLYSPLDNLKTPGNAVTISETEPPCPFGLLADIGETFRAANRIGEKQSDESRNVGLDVHVVASEISDGLCSSS